MLFRKKQIIMSKDNKDKDESKNITLIEKPAICLFDFEDDAVVKLRKQGFNIKKASLGVEISVPNLELHQEHLCLLNFSYPTNIHEFDIIAFNFPSKEPIKYKQENNIYISSKNFRNYYFLSKYPQNVFDPRPKSAYLFGSKLSRLLKKKMVLIVFAGQNIEIEYQLVELSQDGYTRGEVSKNSIYDFCDLIQVSSNKNGHEVEILTKHEGLRKLLENYEKEIQYKVTFYHQEEWENGKRKPIKEFIPLLKDSEDDIVSFIRIHEKSIILVFPDLINKVDFFSSLLNEILPDIIPELFPYSTAFKWKDHKEYWLPNHDNLLKQKKKLQEEHKKQILGIDNKIKSNNEKYKFLHDLISETGELLVLAVKKYLQWLGFDNVKIMDNELKTIKEEDIQIDTQRGLLIIEVKGIGGTSTDSDCSQIFKIVNRRQKERKSFDVHGIYIVNHQRYLPPLKRNNPPFSGNQIKDAENDERGLLTTWELYKLFYLIEDNIISKEDAIKTFYNSGLISFTPKIGTHLGTVKKVFKNNSVFILNLSNCELKIGDNITIRKGKKFTKAKILNIQVNGKNVSVASNNEVGIKIDRAIKKNSEIYKA